jgi:hypothetical protein
MEATLTRPTFEQELEKLINKYSLEKGSNTPDFILATYLVDCLDLFNRATRRRDNFLGDEPR